MQIDYFLEGKVIFGDIVQILNYYTHSEISCFINNPNHVDKSIR